MATGKIGGDIVPITYDGDNTIFENAPLMLSSTEKNQAVKPKTSDGHGKELLNYFKGNFHQYIDLLLKELGPFISNEVRASIKSVGKMANLAVVGSKFNDIFNDYKSAQAASKMQVNT